MTHSSLENPNEVADDTMSKLVGALLRELAGEVPDRPGLESVRTDLLTAGKVYEEGKKKDLALRFYLAFRSMIQEMKRMEKVEARVREAAASVSGPGVSYQPQESHQEFPVPQ